MERCFSGIMKSLQIQAGLLDPKLLEPEKYRSGIFLETDTGAAVDILLIDASGTEQQLSGLVPAEELVRFASLDLTDYHSAIQQLWQEHPLFEEKSPVPYAEYEDLETKILHFPEWLNSIDTVSGFCDLMELGFADFERGTQQERYQALETSYPNLMHQSFPCRPLPFSSQRRYLAETISAEEFLRGIDLFHELETYKVGKRVLPVPDKTRWRGEIKANLDFDPAIMYQGAMTLNLGGDDPQWEIFSPQEQQDAARGGHGSLQEKYHKENPKG